MFTIIGYIAALIAIITLAAIDVAQRTTIAQQGRAYTELMQDALELERRLQVYVEDDQANLAAAYAEGKARGEGTTLRQALVYAGRENGDKMKTVS